MAKTSSNVMISDFKEWLKGNGNLTPNSANSYISYLGVSYNNDLSLVSTDNVYSCKNYSVKVQKLADINK